MVTVSNVLLVIAIASVMCAVVSAVLLTVALEKRGIAVNWIWLRFRILSRYLDQYRDVTRQETGRTGPLFYVYIVSMMLALVSAVAALIFRVS